MSLTCSVIIRAYNEEKHIGKLLYGLTRQTHTPEEIIVVDSGSTDRTVEIAESFGVKLVTIEKSDFTFGRSLNIGCEAATSEILIIASAHVYPSQSTWIEEMLGPFLDDHVELVYGKQSGCETTKFSEHCIFRSWFPDTSDFDQKPLFCNNANCAVRRSRWEDHRYDEELTGLEDIAWASSLREKNPNMKIVYNAEAEIIHVHDETFKQITNRYFRESLALARIKPEMKMSIYQASSLFFRNTFSDFKEALRTRQFFRQFNSVIAFRAAQFFGAWRARRLKAVDMNQSLHDRLYYPGQAAVRLPNDPAGSASKPSAIKYDMSETGQNKIL